MKSRTRPLYLFLGTIMLLGWCMLGGRILELATPTLAKLQGTKPTIDAWITMPDYTGATPMIIATPAELRHNKQTISVPEGSFINIHMVDKNGTAPQLEVNGEDIEFTQDAHGDYEIRHDLHGEATLSVKHHDNPLVTWIMHVIPNQAPQITLLDTPSVVEKQSVRLSYRVQQDFGAVRIMAHVAPHTASNAPTTPVAAEGVDIPLTELVNASTGISRISLEDLTSTPWSGSQVDLSLVAENAQGTRSQTAATTLTLPERKFDHPVARMLIEERKKLLQSPEDTNVRNEVANLMAGIAQKPVAYNGDPVVMMALRSGAVRLVLNEKKNPGQSELLDSIGDLLWQSALRIEYGKTGEAEHKLRHARKDLSDALRRDASDSEVTTKLDQLHQALTDYIGALTPQAGDERGIYLDTDAVGTTPAKTKPQR